MLNLANVQAPIEVANDLPDACYTDATMYQYEQKNFFRNDWVAVGFGNDLP